MLLIEVIAELIVKAKVQKRFNELLYRRKHNTPHSFICIKNNQAYVIMLTNYYMRKQASIMCRRKHVLYRKAAPISIHYGE